MPLSARIPSVASGIRRMEVIGSAARGDAGPDSDIDIIVTYEPGTACGLFDFMALKSDLEAALGRKVDLLTRKSVENSPNKYFRRFALEKTELLYESA